LKNKKEKRRKESLKNMDLSLAVGVTLELILEIFTT